MLRRNKMADVEEALRFLVSFYVVTVIFKRFQVDYSKNERIAINHGLFQCSNIHWITRKGFEHAASNTLLVIHRMFEH